MTVVREQHAPLRTFIVRRPNATLAFTQNPDGRIVISTPLNEGVRIGGVQHTVRGDVWIPSAGTYRYCPLEVRASGGIGEVTGPRRALVVRLIEELLDELVAEQPSFLAEDPDDALREQLQAEVRDLEQHLEQAEAAQVTAMHRWSCAQLAERRLASPLLLMTPARRRTRRAAVAAAVERHHTEYSDALTRGCEYHWQVERLTEQLALLEPTG